MAGFFDGTLAALADAKVVRFGLLVHFEFGDGLGGIEDRRLWDGFGPVIVDSEEWTGAAEFGSMSDLNFSEDDAAGMTTFTLSGVSPEAVTIAKGEASEVRGHDVTVYGQFFDEFLQPLDDKFTLRQLIMDVMTFSAVGPSRRVISVTAETLWTGRNMASYAMFSYLDQQRRFPGDEGMEFIASLKNKVVTWPDFD